MADEKTFLAWRENFRYCLKTKKREEAFWIMENTRMLGQMEINRLTDSQIDMWFEMLEDFNKTFPENPAKFAEDLHDSD